MKKVAKCMTLTLALALTVLLAVMPMNALAEDITLQMSWWGGESRHEAILKVIELFEAQNPGVNDGIP